MARQDTAIQPRMVEAGQYERYTGFRIAHRAYWEQDAHFEQAYQERLLRIADKESRRHGLSELDSIANWDLQYNQILQPLKDALWNAWEQHVALEHRYYSARMAYVKEDPHALKQLLRRLAELEHKTVSRNGFFSWLALLGGRRTPVPFSGQVAA